MNNIDVRKFYDILVSAEKNLKDNKEYLNSLNVFPVPDGDTGTNMASTFTEAVKKINITNISTLTDVSSSLAKGALMGARGNSGVILSQILRGLNNGLTGYDAITVKALVSALNSACESAYKAVMKPKEGTILTVIKGASESANKNKDKDNLIDFMDCVLVDTKNMLSKTRDMLPENKSAGTVDAGGAGLVVILQAFADVLHGRIETSKFDFNESDVNINFVDIHPALEDIEFQYCTEFIIKSEVSEDELRTKLHSLGDSIVVVSDVGITKVHIHTNEPGTAFNIAMTYGELTKMKIDNMKEQAENNPNQNTTAKPKIEQAIIAVASGDGIEKMFTDAGVHHVISGGQSMNPSVEDIVKAIEEVNANNVIILPNNKNIILSAEQAATVVDSNVFVVKSKTIPQGITASLNFDIDANFEDNCESMSEAIDDVVTAQVTTAVRDSNANGLDIKEGDILGIVEDKITCNGSSYTSIIFNLFDSCTNEDTDLITVIIGDEIEDEYINELSLILEEKYEDFDISLARGNQEVYQFIISFE